MYLSQVELGSPGGSCGGRGALISDRRASVGGSCRHQRAATRVRYYLRLLEFQFYFYRLNAHLSSIVSSKPFQMPVEVVSRTTSSSDSRLSSFGFSGTIAHGAFDARKPAAFAGTADAKSLYRSKSLLNRSQHQNSPMRRIALALDQTNVKVGEEAHTVCCREQIVTLADHWRAPSRSSFGNQTQIADEMEFQRASCSPQFDRQRTQINPLEVMQMRPEACFDLKDNSPEALHIGLANSVCNGATGMLRRTVIPELAYAPFPQSSISKPGLGSNLLQPQSTLVCSTGEANLGAHNFSNQICLSSVIEAEAQAIRLLGGDMQRIQLPTETIST